MTFVLQRHEDGKFVATSGSKHSYTNNIRVARTWATREAAQADACGNESARDVADLLQEPTR